MMLSSHMAMKVWPAQARNIAVAVGAVVPEEQDRILHDLIALIPDAVIVICECDI